MIRKGFHPQQLVLLAVLSFGALTSCSSDSIYEKNVDLDNRVWLADSMVNFPFQILDTTKRYDIHMHFRNTATYPYQNLYVAYQLEDSTGNVLLEDLKNMHLFDAKTGKPYGSGLGDIYSHDFETISSYQFADTGTYNFKVQQFMRRDTLPEILSVGISIKEESPHQ